MPAKNIIQALLKFTFSQWILEYSKRLTKISWCLQRTSHRQFSNSLSRNEYPNIQKNNQNILDAWNDIHKTSPMYNTSSWYYQKYLDIISTIKISSFYDFGGNQVLMILKWKWKIPKPKSHTWYFGRFHISNW